MYLLNIAICRSHLNNGYPRSVIFKKFITPATNDILRSAVFTVLLYTTRSFILTPGSPPMASITPVYTRCEAIGCKARSMKPNYTYSITPRDICQLIFIIVSSCIYRGYNFIINIWMLTYYVLYLYMVSVRVCIKVLKIASLLIQ